MPMLVNNEAKPGIIQMRILNPEGDYEWNFGRNWVNRKKAGLFESSFFLGGGGQFDPPLFPSPLHISRRTNLLSIMIFQVTK